MNKSLLIIGGTGFFGKSFLDCFVNNKLEKYHISSIKIMAREIENFKKKFPELVNEKTEFIQNDITIINELPDADLIIHAATSTNSKDYLVNGTAHLENIEKGVSNFCKIALFNKIQSKIVYCSSGAVYGQQPSNFLNIDEDFPFQNVCTLTEEKQKYCLGKRFAEQAIKNLGDHSLNVSIARCYAFYGKYLPKDQHFAYGNFVGQAELGNTIEVNANKFVFRSYMSADDLVYSLIKIVEYANPSCPIFNVGSDEGISIQDLAKKIANEYNVPYKLNEITDFENIDRYVPNVDKLKKILN